jgi:FAD/FMN-containing dehydrogenase
MKKRFASMVGTENVSDSLLDLEAYSYCGSETELMPSIVMWPQTTEQARRVLLFANQARLPVIIRGAGTSLVDGCISENALVLSSERMNKVTKLDLKNKLAEAEAGLKITDLNNSLRDLKMQFPLTPFNPNTTVGGLLALNPLTKESQGLGKLDAWVDEIEFVDGTGKSFLTRKKEIVLGKEGLSGFIIKAKLRIVEIPTLSFDIFSFNELSELLGQVRSMKKDKEVYFLEFVDKKIAQNLGFEPKPALFVAYSNLKGKVRTIQGSNDLLEKINSVHSIIRREGCHYIEDPCVSLEKAYDLIEWCEKHGVRLHGHIGLGVFYAYFQKKDKDLVEVFRSFVWRIDGSFGRVFGHSAVNKDFINSEHKKELIKLKDEHDYNNILNSGKLINYR